MELRTESLFRGPFMNPANMAITGQRFLINQHEFGSGGCDALNPSDKRNVSWVYTLLCITYSISDVIRFLPRTTGF